MILQTPNGQHITFPLPMGNSLQVTQVTIASITFDLAGHTFTVVYGIGGGIQKTWNGPIPGGFLTNLEAALQSAIENAEGWTPGSSTIQTP